MFVRSGAAPGADPSVLKFSVFKLAAHLTGPALELEFTPESPWADGWFTISEPTLEPLTAETTSLRDRFRDAVETAIGDSDRVAVDFSGGLDSFAVLTHAADICKKDGRHLLAVTTALRDDDGIDAASIARQLIASSGVDCAVHEIPVGHRAVPDLPWDSSGPYLNMAPRLNMTTCQVAAELGADVLLDGVGGDEILMAHEFLTPRMLSAGAWRDIGHYLRDHCVYDRALGLPSELCAMAASVLPAAISARLYFALHAPRAVSNPSAALVEEPYRSYADEWSKRWFNRVIDLYRSELRSWSATIAWETAHQYRQMWRAEFIRQRSPFLDCQFARYALSLPQHRRYSARGPVAYHRFKTLVIDLLPDDMRAWIPRHKQLYSNAMSEYFAREFDLSLPLCREVGLLGAATVRQIEADPRVPPRLMAIEHWLEGALAAGATPSTEAGIECLGGWAAPTWRKGCVDVDT